MANCELPIGEGWLNFVHILVNHLPTDGAIKLIALFFCLTFYSSLALTDITLVFLFWPWNDSCSCLHSLRPELVKHVTSLPFCLPSNLSLRSGKPLSLPKSELVLLKLVLRKMYLYVLQHTVFYLPIIKIFSNIKTLFSSSPIFQYHLNSL